MSRRRSAATFPLIVGIVAALAISGTSSGAPSAPLPVLDLQSLEGAAVPRAGYVRSGPWVLVYVMPFAGATPAILNALEASTAGGGPPITVVVGGSPADAAELAARHKDRLPATWFADPKGASRAALGLKVLPVIIGVRDQETHWTLAGGGVERSTLRSVVVSWR